MARKRAVKSSETFPNRKATKPPSLILKRTKADNLKNQSGKSNKPDFSTHPDVKDLFNKIVKELSVIRKKDGLIIGTNEVLRLLSKEKLAVIFMNKDKASVQIKTSVSKICMQADVALVWLEENDKHILGPQFPKSITYGIKKESLTTLENLRSLLELLPKTKKENDVISQTDISSNEKKLSSTEERTTQELLDVTTFYHTHEGHISKRSHSKETGFLSLNKFSKDERETDFLDYDSMACCGILSIR